MTTRIIFRKERVVTDLQLEKRFLGRKWRYREYGIYEGSKKYSKFITEEKAQELIDNGINVIEIIPPPSKKLYDFSLTRPLTSIDLVYAPYYIGTLRLDRYYKSPSLREISLFSSLRSLNLKNQESDEDLNIENLKQLRNLTLSRTNITNIILPKSQTDLIITISRSYINYKNYENIPNIIQFTCKKTLLEYIHLESPVLQYFKIAGCGLNNFKLDSNNLRYLYLPNNNLSEVDISMFPRVCELDVSGNPLSYIDIQISYPNLTAVIPLNTFVVYRNGLSNMSSIFRKRLLEHY